MDQAVSKVVIVLDNVTGAKDQGQVFRVLKRHGQFNQVLGKLQIVSRVRWLLDDPEL